MTAFSESKYCASAFVQIERTVEDRFADCAFCSRDTVVNRKRYIVCIIKNSDVIFGGFFFKRRRDAPGKQRLTGPQKMKQRLNRETIDAIFNRNIRAVFSKRKRADDEPGMDTGFFERRRFAYYGNMFGDGAAVVRLRGQSVMTKRTARFC